MVQRLNKIMNMNKLEELMNSPKESDGRDRMNEIMRNIWKEFVFLNELTDITEFGRWIV